MPGSNIPTKLVIIDLALEMNSKIASIHNAAVPSRFHLKGNIPRYTLNVIDSKWMIEIDPFKSHNLNCGIIRRGQH
jgi:hypothetical protein